jgi:hypothetical protein
VQSAAKSPMRKNIAAGKLDARVPKPSCRLECLLQLRVLPFNPSCAAFY